MYKVWQHINAHKILYAGILIHILFYISVIFTGWFDSFFSGAALHVGAKGIDYFQVPRGAWAFLRGGSLMGEPLANGNIYGKEFFSNDNVYHPFFTITLGSLLSALPSTQSPYFWLGIKFILTMLVVVYLYRSFRDHPYVQWGIFLLLTNFSVYLELAAWQFHYVLNLFFLLFLVAIAQQQSRILSGFYYALSLLVKPIGILFIPILLIKRRRLIVVIGIGIFLFCTVSFWLNGGGLYYIDNLKANLLDHNKYGPNQIITLNALLQYSPITNWPTRIYQIIQYTALLLTVFIGALRRTSIYKAIFLMVAYYLCFYDLVFEYQWSTLAVICAICLILVPEFQTRWSRLCLILINLPGCFILFVLLHKGITNDPKLGLLPSDTAWQWMVISKVLPLLLLCGSVCAGDLKPILQQCRQLWNSPYKLASLRQLFSAAKQDEKPAQS